MAAQMTHLATVAELPLVTVQVVSVIEHACSSSGHVLSEDAAWCEHLAAGGVYTDPHILADLSARFDSLRSECYRASYSTGSGGDLALDEVKSLFSDKFVMAATVSEEMLGGACRTQIHRWRP